MSGAEADSPAGNGAPATASPGRQVVRRMLSHWATILALAGIVLMILVAIFAPLLTPYDPNYANVLHRHQGPSWTHPLGTDGIGRDTLARIIFGTRTAVWTSFESVAMALLIGVPIGLLVGFLGGWWDRLTMRVTDIFQSIPSLIFAFALIAVLGRGTNQTALAVAIVFAVILIRIARALALREREFLYVDAARVAGMSTWHILFREILPNTIGPIIVEAAIMLGSAIMIITMLSFLGLGLDATVVDWGSMLDEARNYQATHPYLALPPGLAIIFAVLMFNFAGDGLRDALSGKASSQGAVPRRRRAARVAGGGAAVARVPDSDVITVRNLKVAFPGATAGDAPLEILSDVGFSLRRGETLGLVGESGSGKSISALSLLGLVPAPGEVTEGEILFDGRNLATLSEAELARIRGREIAMIFQDSIAGFSPVHTIGAQLAEPLRIHKGLSADAARERVVELLDLVGVPDARERINDYPHQLSGGMAQRASIAMALSCGPRVLLADEPTTALDVTIQAQVLDLLGDLQKRFDMSVLLITHDLGVVAETCDRVVVMYAGQIVEEGAVADVLAHPRHPYTHALLTATPRDDMRVERLPTVPGAVPPPWAWPGGCRFMPRCAFARPECGQGPVPFVDGTRCLRVDELDLEVAR